MKLMLHATIMFVASNAKMVQNPSMLTILAFEKVEGNCHISRSISNMPYLPYDMDQIIWTIYIVHIIWSILYDLILYDPSHMVHIISYNTCMNNIIYMI